MAGSTLLFRHLPSSLTRDEKEDFLRHFGATRVRIMDSKGPLKHTAFAEFPSSEIASEVLAKLHQVELLGCRLIVELARGRGDRHLPATADTQPRKIKQEGEEDKDKKEEVKEEQEENAFDFSFLQWGLKYPRRRRLYYLYPPPSPSILTNIANALSACPRFYVQVLHLMNKMDLPAPFGPVTAQPPVAADRGVSVDYADVADTREREMSSTEESELESDTEADRPSADTAVKRKKKRAESKRQMRKQARLAMKMFQPLGAPAPEDRHPPMVTQQLQDVFEQRGEGGGARKIQLRLPSTVTDAATAAISMGKEATALPQTLQVHENLISEDTSERGEAEKPEAQSTGFGIITPIPQKTEEGDDQEEEEGWSETKFISRSDLRKGRLSHREMENVSIFRNYKEGEPSRRLYIKNLTKHVTEEDIHWIFGRYINWDDEAEKNIFDIRLMKEGRMKGQAFITLAREEEAIRAVRDTNAFVLKGKPMAVQFARSAKVQDDNTKS